MAKRVLLLGNYPPPYGGVPTHIKYLADYLAGRDWDVHVVSFVGPAVGVEHSAGYPVHRFVRNSRWSQLARSAWAEIGYIVRQRDAFFHSPRLALSQVGTLSFVRALVRRHNIGLISAYHILGAGIVGAWLNAEQGTRLITTVFGELYSQTALHRRRLAEVREVVARSSRLLSCSHHCAASFQTLGLSPSVEAVHYGIDTARFRPGSGGAELRTRLGIAPGTPVVLYVARMVREMGLDVLLAAIPEVLSARPEASFLIVGTRGELTGEAEAHAARYPGHVIVAADAPVAELPAYYDACAFAVAPSVSTRACLGLAIAEAMSSAKAVIGARVGGTAEVIAEGETGVLVPPADNAALAAAIIAMLDDETTRERMGRQGRSRATALFDKERTNRRMEQIFEEVLA